MPRPARRTLSAALALALAGAPALAEEGMFDVSVAGIRAGIVAYEGTERGGVYEVRGSGRASGIVGAFTDGSLDVASNGLVEGNSYRPSGYSEVAREDGEETRRRFTYAGGVPSVTRTPPRKKPEKFSAPAAQQGGTLDPMTATFAMLRDRPEALACKLDFVFFDGTRRSTIRLDEATERPGGLTCKGEYRRVAGFDPEDLGGRKIWPVTLEYEAIGNGILRVSELSFPTSFGNARLRRR